MQDLSKLKEEYNRLTEELMDPELISHWERFQEVSRRRKALERVVQKAEELEAVRQRIDENNQLIAAEESPELSTMAEQELSELALQETRLNEEIEALLKQEEKPLPGAVIMEIRAGTGGEEAALFASELWSMYGKYAEQKGWRNKLLNLHEAELGGVKEVSFEVEGEGAFANLRHEAGVHRVQRIPETEKQGRIHTSTVSVAVLPRPKKEEFQLNPSEVKTEFTTSSGPGGQNVNKRQTAVRLTHLPTGLTVTAETSRTQQANKEAAFALLQARLAEERRESQERELAGKRKTQIGSAERSEKIRTYNFPQDRVTDHRIKKSWHGIEKIVQEGNLEEIALALQEGLGD